MNHSLGQSPPIGDGLRRQITLAVAIGRQRHSAYQESPPLGSSFQSNGCRTWSVCVQDCEMQLGDFSHWSCPTNRPDLASPMYCIWRHHSLKPTRRTLRKVRSKETMSDWSWTNSNFKPFGVVKGTVHGIPLTTEHSWINIWSTLLYPMQLFIGCNDGEILHQQALMSLEKCLGGSPGYVHFLALVYESLVQRRWTSLPATRSISRKGEASGGGMGCKDGHARALAGKGKRADHESTLWVQSARMQSVSSRSASS